MNRRIWNVILAAGMAAGLMAAPAMADHVQESDIFLPVTAAENYLDHMPEELSDRMNENGQLQVGDGYLFCNGSWQKLGLQEGEADNYPALAQRFEQLNTEFEENGTQLLDSCWEGGMAAREAGVEEDEYAYHSSSADILFYRADAEVLSFMRHDVWFAGGPYLSDRKIGWSIDPQTGENLKVSDVFTDPDGAYEMLKAKLEENFPADYSPVLYSSLESWFKGEDVDGISMTVGYENVAFYIAPEIATSRETVQEFLTFSELGDKAAEAYTFHQTNYAVDVLCDPTFTGEFTADLRGDGSRVQVLTYASTDEYKNIAAAVIAWDGQEVSYPLYGYKLQTKLIRLADGAYCFYIDAWSDNDWHETYVMKYQNGTWEKIGELQGSFESRYEYMDEAKPWILLDPDDVLIDTRFQILSTNGARRHAWIGEDGMPEFSEDYWIYSYPIELTLRMELQADTVDLAGNVTGSKVLPAGTVLKMYRSNNGSVEDLTDSEGNIYRLYAAADEWPRLVNGVELDELFDGVIFAG